MTASSWNGSTGGILAIDVAGNLSLGGATVSVDGTGFRGGGTRQLAGGSGGANNDYRNVASSNYHGGKGEGVAGTPRYVYDATTDTVVDTGVEGYPNGSTARGAPVTPAAAEQMEIPPPTIKTPAAAAAERRRRRLRR